MSHQVCDNYRNFTSFSPVFKSIILNSYFDLGLKSADIELRPETGKAYFSFYQEQCQISDLTAAIHPVTHRDLIDILQELKKSLATRESVRNAIRLMPTWSNEQDDRVFDDAIDLVSRLWLMLPIGTFRHVIMPGQACISWNDGDGTFQSMTGKLFQPTIQKEVLRLDRKFSAFNIEQKAGIKIMWTNNLKDHLCLKDEDTRLAVFHHASFLTWHRSMTNQPYAADLLNETMQTLQFLFPEDNRPSRKWFKKVQADQDLDSGAIQCGQLSLQDRNSAQFSYWHERLSTLQLAFNERVKEKEARQWWYDRRWYAVAALAFTVFFGLVQSIEGAVQLLYAVKSGDGD